MNQTTNNTNKNEFDRSSVMGGTNTVRGGGDLSANSALLSTILIVILGIMAIMFNSLAVEDGEVSASPTLSQLSKATMVVESLQNQIRSTENDLLSINSDFISLYSESERASLESRLRELNLRLSVAQETLTKIKEFVR